MNRKKINAIIILILSVFILPLRLFAEEIDVFEEGVSDSIRNGEQRDYQEALMDAKRKAIEKAGVEIKSLTEVKNFQLKFDYIESKAEAALMPGYQVKKIGYDEKGVYHVVLLGKIQKNANHDSGIILYIDGRIFSDWRINPIDCLDINGALYSFNGESENVIIHLAPGSYVVKTKGRAKSPGERIELQGNIVKISVNAGYYCYYIMSVESGQGSWDDGRTFYDWTSVGFSETQKDGLSCNTFGEITKYNGLNGVSLKEITGKKGP